MPRTPCFPSRRSSSSSLAAWRGRGIGALLLACSAVALAQASTPWAPERDAAPLPGRTGGTGDIGVVLPFEVTAQHSRVLERPGALTQVGGRVSGELVSVSYRVWRSQGRADFGIGVATLGYRQPLADGHAGVAADPSQALVGAVPAVSMGVRLRVTDEHAVLADAYRARAFAAGATDVAKGAKIAVEWRPAKKTFGLEHGALGMQLESGYRLSLKVRHGGPSVYLRSQF